MLDTILSLSEQFVGSVKLDVGACLNGMHRGGACSYCVKACPTDAITTTGDIFSPVKLDQEACVRCGACVAACPTGAFTQPRQAEEQENVTRVLNDLRGIAVELTCPQHPGDEVSVAPVGAVVDIGRCLGSLPLSSILAWVLLIGEDLWLNDLLCADCPIGQLAGWIATTAQSANLFLEAWGKHERVRLTSSLQEDTGGEHPVDFYDGQQPAYSRRDFFKALGKLMFRTVSTIVEEAMPVPLPSSDSEVPLERLKLRAVLSAMGEPKASKIELKGLPFGALSIGDSCSGCNLCVRICPTDALTSRVEENRYSLEFLEADCIGCDLCAMTCPEKAIDIESALDVDLLTRTSPVPLVTGRLVSCKKCGAPIREREGMEPLCHICRVSYTPQQAEIDEMLEDLRKLGPA